MSSSSEAGEFIPVKIALLTVSDTRNEQTDTSGQLLVERLDTAGHHLVEKVILPDSIYRVRALVSKWIAEPSVEVVIITGGTGMTDRDHTPEAITPLLDKTIDGFGELFRAVSYEEIGSSTIQSRVLGGIANGTFIFAIPGSNNACSVAWDRILGPQFDSRTRPCNFVQLFSRLKRD